MAPALAPKGLRLTMALAGKGRLVNVGVYSGSCSSC